MGKNCGGVNAECADVTRGIEFAVPLTLEFLLNEEIPVPLPQGARGGAVDGEAGDPLLPVGEKVPKGHRIRVRIRL